jgi:hypothetical protein
MGGREDMLKREDPQRVGIGMEELGLKPGAALADAAAALLTQQKQNWEMLRGNFAGLAGVQTREFYLDGYSVRVQFNPGRLTSSAARVDERSIRERKCFLCMAHLPAEQRGVPFGDRFMVLCNPFPIFPEHFTIPHCDHVPQRIGGELTSFLQLANDLAPRYTVFYNGPRCGASAPDHLHFQAGTRTFMPIEDQYAKLRTECGAVVRSSGSATLVAVDGGGRRFVAVEGSDRADVEKLVAGYCVRLQDIAGGDDEAMMNIIAWYDAASWIVLIFPRVKHRPSFYFAEGDERLLISPAAVDLGGVSITPIEADFRKVTREHLRMMLDEVVVSPAAFAETLE